MTDIPAPMSDDLPSDIIALLQAHHFDARAFESLRSDLRAGDFPLERNEIVDPVEPPTDDDLVAWAGAGSQTEAGWLEIGQRALAEGRVAVLILNGGMATRFGGVVKGVVEVLDGKSFLGLRLEDVAQASDKAPIFLMNSFATDVETKRHLEAHDNFGLSAQRLFHLTQRISLRLLPSGELFRDTDGRPVPYAPGHGDVFEVLAESEAFVRFRDQPERTCIMLGNVDNLAATLSPKVIGAHLCSRRPVTVEVTERRAGDKGGAPVRTRGRVEILEGFRFPADFDPGRVPVFNTNTLIVDASAVRSDYPLTWFRADKKVDAQTVVQFERLMGEVTSFVEAGYLTVPREGPENRFMPVKTPEDLEAMREVLRTRLGL